MRKSIHSKFKVTKVLPLWKRICICKARQGISTQTFYWIEFMPWLFYWSCRNLPRIYVFLYKFKKKALIAPELTFMSSFGLTDNPINASCKISMRKVQGVPQSQAAAHPGHRGRGNRQIQTSANQTNARKALRLALSSPSEVIAMLKGLKKYSNKITQGKT